MMLQADLNVYIVLFPEGKDPDSYVRELGHDAFDTFIQTNEKDFILFQADLQLQETKADPIKRSAFVNDMIKTIAFIEDAVKRAAYVQELATQAKMPEEIIITELNKELKKRLWEKRKNVSRQKQKMEDSPSDSINAPLVIESDLHPKEREILRVLMNGGHTVLKQLADITVRDFILEQLKEMEEFANPLYNKFYQEVRKSADEPWSAAYFKNHPDDEIRKLSIALVSEGVEISENWQKKWDIQLQTQPMPEENFYLDSLQATLRLKLEHVKLITKQNIEILKSLEEEEEINRHLEIQGKLSEMTKELANELRAIVLG